MKESILRAFIRNVIEESTLLEIRESEEIEEERITNPEAIHDVQNKKNFIGSHIFGEDLGDLKKMYVAYSYGEQFPVFLHYHNQWYHNIDNYLLPDGSVNQATEEHKENMRPNRDSKGLSTKQLQSMISRFKKSHGLKSIDHTSVKPGEKN